jgi:hypothetical protein
VHPREVPRDEAKDLGSREIVDLDPETQLLLHAWSSALQEVPMHMLHIMSAGMFWQKLA